VTPVPASSESGEGRGVDEEELLAAMRVLQRAQAEGVRRKQG